MLSRVVFDLDGTLVDSALDISAALNRTLAGLRVLPLRLDQVTAMVGDGATVLLQRALAACGIPPAPELVDRTTRLYLADYESNTLVSTAPYPGVTETLEDLAHAGWLMAVCTNKPTKAARDILGGLGLQKYFAAVCGGDSFDFRKPDPRHLAEALAQLGAGGPAAMVGDHHNDIAAARGCGIASVWAAWGYADTDPGADATAARFLDLPSVLEKVTSQSG